MMICKLSASFEALSDSWGCSSITQAGTTAWMVPGLNGGVTVPAAAAWFAFRESKNHSPVPSAEACSGGTNPAV